MAVPGVSMENNLKKNRHLLNALSLIMRITIICFILLLLYAAWPSLHPESFQVFRSWIDHLSQGYVYTVLVPMCVKHGLQNTPIIAVAEIVLIAFIIWKAIFRGGIIAVFKLKTLIMLAMSFAWIWYVLYYGIRIYQTAFWDIYSYIYSNLLLISHAIFLPFVTLNGIDYVMLMIPVILIYFLLYIVVLVNFTIASHTRKLFRLNHRRIKNYGFQDLEEVLNRVGVLHKLFPFLPHRLLIHFHFHWLFLFFHFLPHKNILAPNTIHKLLVHLFRSNCGHGSRPE